MKKLLLTFLLFIGIGIGQANATEYLWVGFSSANWNDQGNWCNISFIPVMNAGYPGSGGSTNDIADIGTNSNLITFLSALLGSLIGKTYAQPVLNANQTIGTLNLGPYAYTNTPNTYLAFNNTTLTVNNAINVGAQGTTYSYFTGTGAVAGTSVLTVSNGSTLNSVAGIPFTCGSSSITQSNAILTFNGTFTCTGKFSTATSATGNTLVTTAASNIIGGLQLGAASALTWSGTSGCSTTVNGTSELYANTTKGAALTVSANNTVNFTSNVGLDAATGTTATLNNTGSLSFTGSALNTNNPVTAGTYTAITNNSGGTIAFTGTGSSLGLNNYMKLTNAGSVTFASASGMTFGTPTYIDNASTGTIAYNGPTITLGSAFTLTNAGIFSLNISANITTSGSSSILKNTTGASQINLSASQLTLAAGSSISNSGSISETGASKLILSGNPTSVTNATSGSSLTVDGSTFSIIAAGAYFDNYGTITTKNTSVVNIQPNSATATVNTNESGGTINSTSTTYNTNAGATITNSGGTINLTTCTFNVANGGTSGVTTINNNNSSTSPVTTGTCNLDNTTISSTAKLAISNAGVFSAYDGSTINFTATGSGNTITNSGTFYAGNSNSSCHIICSSPSVISNPNGTFYVGSTSYINPNYATAYLYNGSVNASSVLINPGTFTFQSDVYGSASLGPIPSAASAGTVLGTFIIQRFVQGTTTGLPGGGAVAARRNYRLMSSPVNTNIIANSFNNSLQNGTGFANSNNYSGVSGTLCLDLRYILAGTLVNGNTTNNLDKIGNPTIYFYRDDFGPSLTTFTGGPFKGVTNISSTSPYLTGIGEVNSSYIINNSANANYQVPIGNGYMVYFRGDRTNPTQKESATTGPGYINDATFQATGFINQGQITVQHWLNSASTNGTLMKSYATGNNNLGLNLVGNPYPCTINIDYFNNTGITETGLNTVIYVLNPTSKTYDSYIPLSTHTSNPTTVYSAVNYSGATGSTSNMITSGAGFYVQAASSTAPTLTFNESSKVLVANPGSGLIMFNSQSSTASVKNLQLNSTSVNTSTDPESWMRVKLVKDSLNMDDISIRFHSDASGKFDPQADAYDMGGDGETVDLSSYSTDGTIVAINTMPDLSNIDSIKLYVSGTTTGLYSLQFPVMNNIDPRFKIFLKDNYKKDSLNVTDYSNYGFNINRADTNSFGKNRFVLMVRHKFGRYKLISFNGIKEPSDVKLTWSTQGETTYSTFTVQKTTDGGKTYNDIGTVQANDSGTYNLLDNNPINGVNIYRLKQVDTYNDTTYSAAITIIYSSGVNASIFTVSPNPTADVLKINLNGSQTGNMKMTIFSMGGEVMQQHTFSGGTYSTSVSDMIHGVYIIQVVDANSNYLIGRAKFIKL